MNHSHAPAARKLLLDMLQEAAKLEHSLLNVYVVAACSLKSTPQEFQEPEFENLRASIQFERVRRWKESILNVAHEEMRHLHYVQCMIRALGGRPFLSLPDRDDRDAWVIPNWRIKIGERPGGPNGAEIPVRAFDFDAVRRFMCYESTDSLQDQDPFGPEAMALYRRLYDFELDLRLEGMFVDMPDGPGKTATLRGMRVLYTELRAREPEVRATMLTERLAATLPPIEDIHFQSIADFYLRGILPLYRQAFEEGWVVNNDRNLVDEQLDPDYAREGFLPVGPIGRTAKFAALVKRTDANPLKDYRNVEDVIGEIVEEGEGASAFSERAGQFLEDVERIGVKGFMQALAQDAASARTPGYATPDWLQNAQMVRTGHLYAFTMIMVEYEAETDLAQAAGVSFTPARRPQPAATPALRKLADQLPAQFNATYMAMLAWLGRMYEPRHWEADHSRRVAIEMLATWPLMSIAVRPFLELASLLPIDPTRLFRLGQRDLPMLPIWAQEMAVLFDGPDRSEAVNARIDDRVVKTLSSVALWAREQVAVVRRSAIAPHEREMILSRLDSLSHLDEFERQFPFRVAGGYSNRLPNLSYRNGAPEALRFEERPDRGGSTAPLFAGTPVLRLRFRGWGLVQLATDPDPPTDEAGCTGTLMLHADDGDRRFDRALVWQDYEPERNISRSPGAPRLGVDVVSATLMMPDLVKGATAGYMPLGVMSSSGAVQTTGVQQRLGVEGLHALCDIDLSGGRPERRPQVFLEAKGGVRPFLNGNNHLVWKDGEPIDPFILSIYGAGQGGEAGREALFSREIYNEGRSILEMEPLQRLRSARGPCGFDDVGNIPDWARGPDVADAFRPGFPGTFLKRRSRVLSDALAAALARPDRGGTAVASIASLADRLRRVAQPTDTTRGWLSALLHYGHTVSGPSAAADSNPLLVALGKVVGVKLDAASVGSGRDQPNARWLVSYTKGMMDTDALSNFVYGEIHIPLTLAVDGPVTFAKTWRFPAGIGPTLSAYACDFAHPFWAIFAVNGEVRSIGVTGLDAEHPGREVRLTETCKERSGTAYVYAQEGFPGMTRYTGQLACDAAADRTTLTWTCTFASDDPAVVVRCLSLLAGSVDIMTARLAAFLAPQH